MKRSTIVMLLVAAIAVAACGGQSKEDKAKSQVCDARADVRKQVDQLKGLTLQTATIDGVKANLTAIRNDLGKISSAQSDLSDSRRQQVQSANKAFTDQVRATVQNVGRSLSLADAKTQIQGAVSDLAASYQQTLGRIDCG